MQSNYDKQVFIARDLFLKYDQKDIIERYDLKYDEDYLYMVFIGDTYRISRKSGEIEVSGNTAGAFEVCNEFRVVMSLYDVLCHPVGVPSLANEWCSLQNLATVASSPSADIFNQKYADAYAGNVDGLKRACENLGGTLLPRSAGADVCCQFDLFPFFPLQFRFWDADDEFSAQIKLLWDRNSLQFMHFETLYYAMGHLMEKLMEQ